MSATSIPKFSEQTLKFILKASRQKNPNWLDRNRTDYDSFVLDPLKYLSNRLKGELAVLAPGYHFPQKGIGRIKRSANRVDESGSLYKNWISYSAARPPESRFEHNPSLFFMINPEDDEGDQVLVAGGLYMPSSRQVRLLRQAVAQDASAFQRLFASKSFASSFKQGFSNERISSRVPRGFDPAHPRMDWLRLQAFFVWRSYSKRDFFNQKFADKVVQDWKQALRLNELLDKALSGQLTKAAPRKKAGSLISSLKEMDIISRKLDF